MYTRKIFEATAAILKDSRSNYDAYESQPLIDEIAQSFANVFCQNNPRFDRARFLKACGVKS